MNSTIYPAALLLLISCWISTPSQAQTTVTNLRLRTNPTVKKVIIEYELPQVLPDDSIYIELETASGRIVRPISVNGDVGKAIKPGKNKLIAWDVVRDDVRLNEDVNVLLRVARMVTVTNPPITSTQKTAEVPKAAAVTAVKPTTDRVAEPGTLARRKSPVPIIGWAATAGLAGYATVLALGLNKNVDEYNAEPYARDEVDLQRYRDLKAKIDKDKDLFTIVAGAAGAVAVANVVYSIVRKPTAKARRTSLLIQSGNHVTSLGVSRRF